VRPRRGGPFARTAPSARRTAERAPRAVVRAASSRARASRASRNMPPQSGTSASRPSRPRARALTGQSRPARCVQRPVVLDVRAATIKCARPSRSWQAPEQMDRGLCVVDALRIGRVHARQRRAQAIGVGRHQDQVDVVVHQAPREAGRAVARASTGQQPDIERRSASRKRPVAPVAPLDDVIREAGTTSRADLGIRALRKEGQSPISQPIADLRQGRMRPNRKMCRRTLLPLRKGGTVPKFGRSKKRDCPHFAIRSRWTSRTGAPESEPRW
jgi:hypothetical protein